MINSNIVIAYSYPPLTLYANGVPEAVNEPLAVPDTVTFAPLAMFNGRYYL